MMKTFEPFRQFKDNVWHDYALISTQYTRFEVVDLEIGKIVATEAYPTYTQEMYDWLSNRGSKPTKEVGEEMPGSGFCPVEFKVFNWHERFNEDSLTKKWTPRNSSGEQWFYNEKEFYSYAGHWAIYSGCVWGDDSGGWKVRYIDLSRISEGIVTSEERFGYIQLAGALSKVEYDSHDDRFIFPIELSTSREDGKSYPVDAIWDEDN